MNSTTIQNAVRFVFLLMVQVIILRRLSLDFPGFPYLNVLIYPLFILLLPLRTPRWAQFLLAFSLGMCVDLFYDSPGIHTSALVFTTYARHYVLRLLEPRGGYNITYSPTKQRMGLPWFLRYCSFMLGLHCFFYFSVEAFTFFYIFDILLKTLLGFIFTMILVLILTFIFNPQE